MKIVYFLDMLYVQLGQAFIKGPFLGDPELAYRRAKKFIAMREAVK